MSHRLTPLPILCILLLALAAAACTSPPSPAVSTPTSGPAATLTRQPGPPARPSPTPTPPPSPSPTPDLSVPVWIANPVDRTVLRIDPSGAAETLAIQLDAQPGPLAAGDSGVWVVLKGEDGPDRLARIDPQTGRLAAAIEVSENRRLMSLAAAGARIWAGLSGPMDPGQLAGDMDFSPEGGIGDFDPAAGAQGEVTTLGAPAHWISIHGDQAWASLTGLGFNRVVRLDGDGKSWEPFYNAGDFPVVMAYGRGSLWLAPVSPAAGRSELLRLDAQSGTVLAHIVLGNENVTAIAADDQAVWVATRSGKIKHIDPATNLVITSIDTGAGIEELFIQAGSLWVHAVQEGLLLRIDMRSHRVAQSISTGSALPTLAALPADTTPTPWQACPDAPPSRLSTGMSAYVSKDPPLPNRVRSQPDRTGETVGYIQPGEEVDIIAGPSCSETWVWWKVRARDSGLSGWTAEGDADGYWLVPKIEP